MTLQNRVTQAANVAKWKIDQTARIHNIQSQIRGLTNEADHKYRLLAEEAYRLYVEEGIDDPALVQICDQIKAVLLQIEEKQANLELIRAEEPPSLPETEKTFEYSGLVCPECNLQLVGKFCPTHGLEGVVPKPKEDPKFIESSTIPEGTLVCPKCKLPLVGKFCPEHGVEGVPVVRKTEVEEVVDQTETEEEPDKGTEVMVCPECGLELVGEFCPEHGLKGIIKIK